MKNGGAIWLLRFFVSGSAGDPNGVDRAAVGRVVNPAGPAVHADTTGFDNRQHYLYPHDFPYRWVEQQYLPDALKDAHYYQWGDNKTEQAAKAYWERIKGKPL